MAAAMLPRLVAMAALVALMCAITVAQKIPAVGGAPVCNLVDQNVVNACFESFGKGRKDAVWNAPGRDLVDCCVAFGSHPCLCEMKKAWKAQRKTSQDKVRCVR